MRPPDLPGGKLHHVDQHMGRDHALASMRPPDLPGGNKIEHGTDMRATLDASMRPPDLPGGNVDQPRRTGRPGVRNRFK